MSEKHEVDIAVMKSDISHMRKDIDGLKTSQSDQGIRLEDIQRQILVIEGTIKSWGTGIVVAITVVEVVLKFFFR